MNSFFKKKEIFRYLIVGFSTVILDFLVYHFLLNWLDFNFAKAISFTSGTIWSYNINRSWTFAIGKTNITHFIKFWLVHMSSLIINVLTNNITLRYIADHDGFKIRSAFLIATATSTIINYLGIKFLVFNKKIKT